MGREGVLAGTLRVCQVEEAQPGLFVSCNQARLIQDCLHRQSLMADLKGSVGDDLCHERCPVWVPWVAD